MLNAVVWRRAHQRDYCHGTVQLEVRNIQDSSLEVAVRDSGQGVPEEMKTAIFERFAQLDRKDRRGLGLGLYIVKKIMDAHGGRMWVEANADQGSTFVFTLPRPAQNA